MRGNSARDRVGRTRQGGSHAACTCRVLRRRRRRPDGRDAERDGGKLAVGEHPGHRDHHSSRSGRREVARDCLLRERGRLQARRRGV